MRSVRPVHVKVGPVEIGGGEFCLIAGPCAVEDEESLFRIGRLCKEAGASMLRGGAFKPRTNHRSFQGLGVPALEMLRRCSRELGIPVVTEVMDTRLVAIVARFADMLQVGARNMQNFDLLKEVGRSGKPVLLKRGAGATVQEFIAAAGYIAAEGNRNIVLCERGIRTFEDSTRYTLDVAAVPLLKQAVPYPVLVDPSHAAGRSDLVAPLALAGVGAGADGLLVEVHDRPDQALCDGPQALHPGALARLASTAARVAAAIREETAIACS